MDEVTRKENIAGEVAQKVFINYGSDGYLLNLIIKKLEQKLDWPEKELMNWAQRRGNKENERKAE